MVSKKIEATLCNRTSNKQGSSFNTEPSKPIPGWTDGSHAWRESVYNFSPRPSSITTVGTEQKPSFAASSHRGVQWTLTNGSPGSPSSLPATQCSNHSIPRSSQSYQDELYAKYYLPFTRRSESRTTLFPPSTFHSSSSIAPVAPSSTSTRRRRENPVIKASAEGRLLVPKVTLRAHSSSGQSVSSASPLSRDTSELSEDSMSSDQRSSSDSARDHSRPPVSVRSWSYENVRTYPVMMPRPKKEKRMESRLVDGELKEVEVEVEIVQPLKRLFLFPDKETSCERRT